jgi:hypothetical protein
MTGSDTVALGGPTGNNGFFTFSEFSQDPNITDAAQHFGITTDYTVNGNFALASSHAEPFHVRVLGT